MNHVDMADSHPHLSQTASPPAPPPHGKRMLWLVRFLWGASVCLVVAAITGFIAFAESAASYEMREGERVDGIVAVTGGEFRINDAVETLMQRQGRRLLISGVNRAVGPQEIAQIVPASALLFPCCIDLDYRALNTRGNAIEAASWARRHGFRSLMVVTSRWHMPRMELELKREAPDLAVALHPVPDGRFRPADWWRHASSIRIIGIEYAKYLLAAANIRFEQAVDPTLPPKGSARLSRMN